MEGLNIFELAQMIGGMGLSGVLALAVVTLWRSLESARKELGDGLSELQTRWREDVAERAAQVERVLSQEVECRRELASLSVQVERTRARLDALEGRSGD